ncbi:hypothetical protein COF68_06145 [Bacillus toyonensis]|uniref:hypothetical protein n=1 Tax=Bacillus toyonensis TaxID=155322 RepID=UPI000BFB62F4|nr:hypothetical protein [Bacillus toyonensis]PHE64415.1 hypothetical protein COF68_06145 [Bacillus toyonensis]
MGRATGSKGAIVNLNQDKLQELASLTYKDIQASMLLFNLIHTMDEANTVKCSELELVEFTGSRLTLKEVEVTLDILEKNDFLTVDYGYKCYTIVLNKDFVFLSRYDSK